MSSEVAIWAAIASAGAAWIALLISTLSFASSRRALRLAEKQEERRKPLLLLYLQDGFVQLPFNNNHRTYAFLISIRNKSDSSNSISEADLKITYSTSNGAQLTVKVRSVNSSISNFSDIDAPQLIVPTRLDTNHTVSGWLFFNVDDHILKNTEIERYVISIVDTHGTEATIEPIIVRELSRETKSSA